MKPFARSKFLAISSIAALSFTLAPSEASASLLDNPFCGVKHSGPTVSGGRVIYTVRNKCTHAYSFKVWLPQQSKWAKSSGTDATCQSIGAGGEGSYWWTYADPYWSVKLC